jgi:hypothetical protein
MYFRSISFALGFILTTALSPVRGQEFEDFVAAYTGENGVKYLQPLGNALSANMNSGLFHSARIPKMRFNLEIGVVATAALIPTSDQTFEVTPDPSFRPAGNSSTMAPTVFGSTRSATIAGEGGTAFTYPGGIDIGMLPILLPQARIGGILGTDFTLRYLAFKVDEELGNLYLFGYGVRHSISQYLPEVFPIEMALAYYHHNFELENFSQTITNLYQLQMSIRKGVLGAYASLGYETASNSFSYTYTGGETAENVSLVLEDQSALRASLGGVLKIGPVFLNLDYNIGINQVLSLGFGFEIGNK